MAEREIARKINLAWAINTKKDYCQVGNKKVPFDIVCDLAKAISHSETVFANDKPVLNVTHRIPGMVGNAGRGLESGVSQLAGEIVLTNGSSTVIINDQASVRHGDDCKMNCSAAGKSNVPGKIYTSSYLAMLASEAHNIENPVLRNLALANLQVETWKTQAREEFVRGTQHFFKGLKDSAVTAAQALGITGTDAESQAARGRVMAGVEAIGTLMGPPPEMVEYAYRSGNAQYIADIEQMQRAQQAAWGQVGNSIANAWNEAYARGGPVGAATMVFTSIGWNVAAGAATGAGVGLAARVAVNIGGKVLQVSASVGSKIAEVLSAAKTPAQAIKGLDEAIVAAKAAGASADDIAALQAAKEAVSKGKVKPPEGASPGDGVMVKKTLTLEEILEALKGNLKNHPLRQEYENKVRALESKAETMRKQGMSDESIARALHEERRQIGLEYKQITPEPLRDYIYEVNKGRYGDPLGPSFESLAEKYKGNYDAIIKGASSPNSDVDKLLKGFGEWLKVQPPEYIDRATKTLGTIVGG
jgi:hypothetical protein